MSAVSRQNLRFTRVRLENWRNFKAVEVELAQRVFLVGPNASGKSNFLDVFRFLRDLGAIGGGLQAAVDRRGGVSRIRSLAARRQPDVSIAVSVGSDDDPDRWTYELSFTQDAKRRALLKRERVTHRGREIHARPRDEDESDPERRTQTSLEQVNVNREFRELADFFASVRYLHIVPQLIREPDRSAGRPKDPFGGDFLEQVGTTPKKKRDSYLRQILKVAKVAVPQLQELRPEPDNRGAWHLKGRYQHWRPQGAWQTEQDLSDGTLRLFGLLWAVLEEGGPLLLEEPELSLHPEVVRRIPEMLFRLQRRSGRQILISTHSPELLAGEGIGLHETLLLITEAEGTSVKPASAFEEIRLLLAGGLTLPEAVIPKTSPRNLEQLALFPG
ncbi:MAG: chromosome segregation protein SMC [Gaiellaceae bacterium]|nr:MAG: chromosome segregation protein SMC [Gaiellaceae bacterium]